jgi:hypothetical protein
MINEDKRARGPLIACYTDPFELPCKTGKPIIVATEEMDGSVALVAVMASHGEPSQDAIDMMETNAAMFAAAPDLLAACEAMVAEIAPFHSEALGAAKAAAKLAIAKAKGEAMS